MAAGLKMCFRRQASMYLEAMPRPPAAVRNNRLRAYGWRRDYQSQDQPGDQTGFRIGRRIENVCENVVADPADSNQPEGRKNNPPG